MLSLRLVKDAITKQDNSRISSYQKEENHDVKSVLFIYLFNKYLFLACDFQGPRLDFVRNTSVEYGLCSPRGCVCAHMSVHISVCMYVCARSMYMCMSVCACLCTHLCVHVHVCAHMCACVCMSVYACVCAWVCVCAAKHRCACRCRRGEVTPESHEVSAGCWARLFTCIVPLTQRVCLLCLFGEETDAQGG